LSSSAPKLRWLLLAALLLGGVTCAHLTPADGSGGPGGDPLDIPGMDFSQLNSSQRHELSQVLSDEFCYCGCPHTLGTCLREHRSCRHAKRMAVLAARHAALGYAASDISLALGRYYDGFSQPRKALKVDPRLCQGSADAKVTLVEFFDYECPHCGAVRPVLEQFAQKRADKIRFCAVPFVLPSHKNSPAATEAALLARDSGKYWSLSDAIFENQMALSPELIRSLSEKQGLKGDEVQKAISTQKHQAEIDSFREMGRAAGVDSTPTLFINGHKYGLDMNEDVLQHAVDDEAEWVSNKGAWAAD